MKRIMQFCFTGLLLLGGTALLVAQSTTSDQPLGDYARTVRKENAKKPPAAKEYNNDNLPTHDQLSVVGNATDNSANQTESGSASSSGTDAAASKAKPGQSTADRQKGYDEWKGKIADQKSKVDLAAREVDVLQREYKLRAASFYADAGDRLRNSEAWDKEDAQYKEQIAAKQADLDAAKKSLDDMQEDARKSGVPNSERE